MNSRKSWLAAMAATLVSALLGTVHAAFTDAQWSALGSGVNSEVLGLAVGGTNLYAGGIFTQAGGVPAAGIAKWDGRAWSALGAGMIGADVHAIAVRGTILYAGGYFTSAGGVAANYIAKWDGNAWSPLASGMNYGVNTLAVSGTDLYVGGNFISAGGLPASYVAKWDGNAWSALGSGIGGNPVHVLALAVSGTNLYVGGIFTQAGEVPANAIAKWDGRAWSALGSGMLGMNYEVMALVVSGTNLYAGGSFSTAGGTTVNSIARWDGSHWSPLGSGMVGQGIVSALAVSGTDLYAGGWFTNAGGVPANWIAKWDDTAWSAVGSGLNNPINALAVDQAGHLFVGGMFSRAGTNPCANIAQANLLTTPIILRSPRTQTVEVGGTVGFAPEVLGRELAYQWFLNGTDALSWGTNRELVLTNVQLSQAGAYTLVVTNSAGAATSAPAMVSVIPPVPKATVPAINLSGDLGSFLHLSYADTPAPPASWQELDAVTLATIPQFYPDLSSPLPASRFYRAWQTNVPSIKPSLQMLGLVTKLTVTGSIGSNVRIDYIAQFGPTDAWATLDTIAMTNTSQPYFDLTMLHQPARLYRLVPVP